MARAESHSDQSNAGYELVSPMCRVHRGLEHEQSGRSMLWNACLVFALSYELTASPVPLAQGACV